MVNVSEVGRQRVPGVSGSSSRATFRRTARLLRHTDFERVYQQGRRHFASHMTVFYLRRNDGDAPRFGFTVGKVLGTAVERNRVKRRLREVVRLHRGTLVAPVDIVINPKKSATKAQFSELETEISRALAVVERSTRESTK